MTVLTCAAALRSLQAFHDGELQVSAQIAVSSHVDHCSRCAAALAEIDGLGSMLRATAPGRAPLPCDEADAFTSTVVNRVKVEHDASFGAWMHDVLEDVRMVYAGVGASLATTMCLMLISDLISKYQLGNGMLIVFVAGLLTALPRLAQPLLAGAVDPFALTSVLLVNLAIAAAVSYGYQRAIAREVIA